MIKKICIIVCLLCLHHPSFCQDTIRVKEKKFQVSFTARACFKGFFGSGYVEPTSYSYYSYGESFLDHQYDRFTKRPAFGFGAGVLFSLRLSKHWRIATGLTYAFRKTIYERNKDTVIRYSGPATQHNIQNVIKYNYTYNNIELPFQVQFKIRKTTFYGGISLSVLSYRNATYTYLMKKNPDLSWYTSQKTLQEFETTFRIYPSFQISYDCKIKNVLIKPFIGIEFFEINMKEFYLHIQTSPFHIYINGPAIEDCYFIHAGVIYSLSL
jgi:hypothetical protein